MKQPQVCPFQKFCIPPIATSLSRLLLTGVGASAQAHNQTLPTVVIESSRSSQSGIADCPNAGVVTQQPFEPRTVDRLGELLKEMPGLIVSQHSGKGKAKLYPLRGFNLDHGTDVRTTVSGMLITPRSHAPGQGRSDLNLLIAELAARLECKKGPYDADQSDFASAGTARVIYWDTLVQGIASVGLGQHGCMCAFLADSVKVGNGNLLSTLELVLNDAPFARPDDHRKSNGVWRYDEGGAGNGFDVTAMANCANWNSTAQSAERAVHNGALGRFDPTYPTDGGLSHRYSLSGGWCKSADEASSKINASIIHNKLDLGSNSTYFPDHPVHGDQFEQPDRRTTAVVNMRHTWRGAWLGLASEKTAGLQLHNDNIFNALRDTVARRSLSTTRQNHVVEGRAGADVENKTPWTETCRTGVGLRGDTYRFAVRGDNPASSDNARASIVSPKPGLIFGPPDNTEYYFTTGSGFHSNDARGSTITVDSQSGAPADKITSLVRSKGLAAGVRPKIIAGRQSSMMFHPLDFDFDSGLVFAGDTGATPRGRPSRRNGFAFNNHHSATRWLTIDADVAFAEAGFRDFDPVGNRIPGVVEGIVSVVLAVDNLGRCFAALPLRCFGQRPLIDDDSVRSHSTATLNGRTGYRINPETSVQLEVLNLTNRRASGVDYGHESRLANEPASVDDAHLHPVKCRSARLTLTTNFRDVG